MTRLAAIPILVFGCLVLIASLAYSVLTYGPELEGTLAPVLDQRAVNVADLGQNFQFTIEGTKLRSCRLENYSVGWRVDHSIIPTALTDKIGNPVSIPDGLQRDEPYTLGPYWVSIPDAARVYKNAALRITYYYRCSFLWPTEQDLMITLKVQNDSKP